MTYPSIFPAPAIIKPLPQELLFADRDGGIYTCVDLELKKSIDQGETWSTLKTFTNVVGKVHKLGAGNILAFTNAGEVWRSDTDGANFELVNTINADKTGIQNLESYGNLVFVSEWGTAPDRHRRIAISRDYGVTWNFTTPIPEKTINHIHAHCYDPYEGLLWVATGDSAQGRRIWWTDDLGLTWQTNDRVSHRITCIMPFPDKVVFGSDEEYEEFTWEYNRVKRGTSGVEITLEKNWSPVKYINETFESTWATRPAIVFGNNPMAYFGYRQAAGATDIPVVWQTDGEKYFPLWKHDKIPSSSVIPAGITGVWGPDKDGKIYASLRTDVGASNSHVVIIG